MVVYIKNLLLVRCFNVGFPCLPWRYAISKWCFVAGTIKFI